MNNGLSKGELWSNVLACVEEMILELKELNDSDDISAGEKKAIKAMNRKLESFTDYAVQARRDFWNKTKGGAK